MGIASLHPSYGLRVPVFRRLSQRIEQSRQIEAKLETRGKEDREGYERGLTQASTAKLPDETVPLAIVVPSPELYDQTSVCPSAALLAGGPMQTSTCSLDKPTIWTRASCAICARWIAQPPNATATAANAKMRVSLISPDPATSKRNRGGEQARRRTGVPEREWIFSASG